MHLLVAAAAPCAREHDDDLQRPRVLPAAEPAARLLVDAEVYGDVHRFEGYSEATADFAFTESPYSASKIASEAFIYAYARCYGLKYLAFRFSNVYGRYDNDLHRMSRVLPLFIHAMSRDEPITVYGGADKVLDFTYIDDCVDGIVARHRGARRAAASPTRRSTWPSARATRSCAPPS